MRIALYDYDDYDYCHVTLWDIIHNAPQVYMVTANVGFFFHNLPLSLLFYYFPWFGLCLWLEFEC